MAPRDRGERLPTIEDVARRAGVSRGTVSRVLNGGPGVSPARAEAVRSAIHDLRYVPNRAARRLVTQRADSVALVFAGAPDGVLGHEYFARVVRGVHAALRRHDLQVVLLIWENESDRQGVERFLSSGHVDGAVLLALPYDDDLPGRLRQQGLAVVVGGRVADPGAVQLDVGNVGGARQAVQHLVAGGRRVIATVAGDQELSVGRDRLAGWRDALARSDREHGDDLVAVGDFTRRSGAEAMAALLARRPDLDGVFAAGDDLALGAMEALRRAGRRVPEDVAVVGFDGSRDAARSVPALSTVAQPLELFGEALGAALVGLLDGELPEPVDLPTELVIRHSSAAAADGARADSRPSADGRRDLLRPPVLRPEEVPGRRDQRRVAVRSRTSA